MDGCGGSPDPIAVSFGEARVELEQLGAPVIVVRDDAFASLVRVPSRHGGVTYRYAGVDRRREVMDPRVALMLVRFGETMAARGVRAIDHYGIFPGTGAPSDVHNRGLAVDLAAFQFADGSKLVVASDWERHRGFSADVV